MDYSDSRLAVQEPAVDAGHVAFLAMVDGMESFMAAKTAIANNAKAAPAEMVESLCMLYELDIRVTDSFTAA